MCTVYFEQVHPFYCILLNLSPFPLLKQYFVGFIMLPSYVCVYFHPLHSLVLFAKIVFNEDKMIVHVKHIKQCLVIEDAQ
jgi:hypothetical protein